MKSKNLIKSGMSLGLLLCAAHLWGQAEEGQASNPNFYQYFGENLLFFIAGGIVLLAFVALFRLASVLLQMHKVEVLDKYGIPAPAKVKKESWWNRMMKSWTKTVPLEKEEDILFDHEYDGIRELDNSLPPWWVALFYISIAFAVVYMTYYHFSGAGPGSREEYRQEMEEADKAVARYLASQANMVDETNVELLSDAAAMTAGETIFLGKCAACHGNLGEGGIGPNMADEYWIHGGTIQDVFKTIKYGVPEKGMISWKDQLRPQEMQMVASYILSLQGSNPPNQKDPEGEIFEQQAEEASEPTDTTTTTQEVQDALGMNE